VCDLQEEWSENGQPMIRERDDIDELIKDLPIEQQEKERHAILRFLTILS